MLQDYPLGDECLKPGMACLSHLAIMLQRVPSPDSQLYKCIVVVEGNILFGQEKTSAETKVSVLNSEIYN